MRNSFSKTSPTESKGFAFGRKRSAMLNYIIGKITEYEEGKLTVECNGIGYEILVSNNTFCEFNKTGETVKVYTYLNVREDGLVLFGFFSKEEKKMFFKLITVTGIGPKIALAILSGMSIKDLAISIANGDTVMLTKIKGVGKKMAERLVLELREKVSEENLKLQLNEIEVSDIESEALVALMALGFSKTECLTAVKAAKALGSKTTEDIIGKALKSLAR